MNDEPRNLSDALDAEFPEGWRPEPGDKLIGTIVAVSTSSGGEYDAYPIVVIREDDGREVACHAFHQVLQSELARARPAIGDRVGIKFLGIEEGRSYNTYRVIVDRPAGAPVDWSAYDPDAPQQQVAPAPPPSAVTAPTAAGAPGAPRDDDIPF